MKIKLLKYLLCGYFTIIGNSLAYAKEPHKSKDHKYSDSVYKNENVITLKGATDLAIQFSPDLKSYKAGVGAARGSEKQAGYWKNPELEIEVEDIGGTGQYSGSNSAQYTYSLSKSLDISGRRFARKGAAGEARKAATNAQMVSRLNIIRNVHIAYAQVLSEAESVKLAKDQQNLAKQILKSVSRRVSAARESEIRRTKATIAYETSMIEASQKSQQLRSAKQKLAKLIGKETLDISLDHSHFFDLRAPRNINSYKEALNNSPILKQSYHLRNEKKFSFKLEKAKKISNPTVKVGMREINGINNGVNYNEQAFVAGVSVALPIFNWNYGNTTRAREELSQARYNELQTKLSLEQNLIEAWKNWQVSYSTAKRLKKSIIPSAKKALRLARSGYKKGRLPYLEVLDAQRTLFEARSRYYEALKQYHTARANIEFIAPSNS